ncbi:MAG: SDR family oxidoreductase [Gemmatimonadales bacterium]|nr:MAG: SDR family oxidoreductase [Gemmatimonadales bacterium]
MRPSSAFRMPVSSTRPWPWRLPCHFPVRRWTSSARDWVMCRLSSSTRDGGPMPELDPFRLDGQRVLLTGAAGHLGRSIGRAIVAAGGRIVLAGRTRSTLSRMADDLRGEGGPDTASVLVVDLADDESRVRAVEKLASDGGSLTGIVNNAYGGRAGSIDDIRAEDFQHACALNLVAPFELTRLLLDLLARSAKDRPGGSSVVNIASMYGMVSPDPSAYPDERSRNPPHYGATKGGLIQMSRYLACHLAPRNVRVNSLAPGPFPSEHVQLEQPALVERLSAKVPMGRPGLPHEVAWAVVFLLSPASSYITGANIPVDGGWTAW